MIISIWLIVALWQKYLHGYCKDETDVYAVSKKARVGSCLGSDKKRHFDPGKCSCCYVLLCFYFSFHSLHYLLKYDTINFTQNTHTR